MATIKRISVNCLKVGMYISEANRDWIPAGNFRKHGPLLHQSIVDKIASLGVDQVYIDVSKGLDCDEGVMMDTRDDEPAGSSPKLSAETSPETQYSSSFGEEKGRAKDLQSNALALIDQVMLDVKTGSSVPVQQVEAMAEGIMGSLSNNQNALACVTQLRDKDRYLLEHSFNVAVLMGILANSLSVEEDELHQLVTGALLHDIGKIRIDEAILNKPGSLDDYEWEEMKRHVTYGSEVLDATAGISDTSRHICSQHHERLDGSGYPFGLKGAQITKAGRMAAVVDVYDAITAERVYHKAMAPTLAMRKLVEWSGDHLDRELVYQFIRCMSIYPAGSLVELSNGRLAIVLEANILAQDRPMVQVIYNLKRRCYVKPEVVDLSSSRVSTYITKAVDATQYKINLADFL